MASFFLFALLGSYYTVTIKPKKSILGFSRGYSTA